MLTLTMNALELYAKTKRGRVQKGEVTHCAIARAM